MQITFCAKFVLVPAYSRGFAKGRYARRARNKSHGIQTTRRANPRWGSRLRLFLRLLQGVVQSRWESLVVLQHSCMGTRLEQETFQLQRRWLALRRGNREAADQAAGHRPAQTAHQRDDPVQRANVVTRAGRPCRSL